MPSGGRRFRPRPAAAAGLVIWALMMTFPTCSKPKPAGLAHKLVQALECHSRLSPTEPMSAGGLNLDRGRRGYR